MSFPYHKQQVTPLAIDIAVHYATCVNDHERMWAPAVRDTIVDLARRGLLKQTTDEQREAGWEGTWKGTEKLRAWVELICKTPFPIEMWVDPRTEEII